MTEGFEDVTISAADAMTAKDAYGDVPLTEGSWIRPLRGRAVVEMLDRLPSILILPDENPREETYYRGRVIALGPPAFVDGKKGSAEHPWGIGVGDEILFSLALWMDKMRIFKVRGVQGRVCVVGQVEILGRFER